MKNLEYAIAAAGFLPVHSLVEVPRLQIKSFQSGEEKLQLLSPRGNIAEVFYFWMPGCEVCVADVLQLQRLQNSLQFSGSIGFQLVVVDTLSAAEVVPLLQDIGYSSNFLVDSEGALAEQLSVLGSPGVI